MALKNFQTVLSGPKARLAVGPKAKSNFKLPGLFQFWRGSSARTIWLEREFDLRKEADKADKLYETWVKMKDQGDYTYPGAYSIPDYVPRRAAWQKFEEARATLEARFRSERWTREDDVRARYRGDYTAQQTALTEMRKQLDLDLETEKDKLYKQMGSPPEIAPERWGAPVHPMANRVIRVSIVDREVEFYDTSNKRNSWVLQALQNVRAQDKLSILERSFNIPDSIAPMVKEGATPATPDNLTREMQAFVGKIAAGTKIHFGWGGVVTELKNALANGAGLTMRQAEAVADGREPLTEEMVQAIKSAVDQRVALLRDSQDYLDAIRTQVAARYYAETGVIDPRSIVAGKALPNKFLYNSSWEPINPWLPLHLANSIPHWKASLAAQVERFDRQFTGGDTASDGSVSASQFFDSAHAERRVAVQDSHQYAAIKERLSRELTDRKNVGPKDCPQVPHLRKAISYFPHQAKALAYLERSGDVAIIDVDMGGGKTSLLFSDAMIQVAKGNATRPCIVMPKSTIPQQVGELHEKFGQDINIIVLNTASWKGFENPESSFGELIRNAPPNTIILVDYNWLTGGYEMVHNGDFYEKDNPKKKIKAGDPIMVKNFVRPKWLVSECGVDMVTLDESHTIKNTQSDVCKAAQELAEVPVKRIASGTVFPNTPGDIFGQMTFLNPGIFGTFEQFCTEYSLKAVNGKVSEYTTGSIKRIRQTLQDKANMLTMRRTNWMHMLPERVEQYHSVTLTPELQGYYNVIWSAILDNLTNPDAPGYNPAVAASWNSFGNGGGDDDEKESSGEKGLLSQLIVIDQFLACPTSEIGGDLEKRERGEKGDMENVSRLDKIPPDYLRIRRKMAKYVQADEWDERTCSPKVKKCAEIIDEHLTSARSVMSDGSRGKVLVFCKFVETAEHFAKWIPHFTSSVSTAQIAMYSSGMDTLDRFKKDPNMLVLVCVDQSVRVGHNLQMANCAIRVDLLWSPGDTEQVFGRVYRPGTKAPKVYIHTIVTEGTGEIAKLGRLLCKYHYMRKINSEFTDEKDLTPIIMSPSTMDPNFIGRKKPTNVYDEDDGEYDEDGYGEGFTPDGDGVKNGEAILRLDQISAYIERYAAAEAFDVEESKALAQELGKEMISGKQGGPLPGSHRIETLIPFVDDKYVIKPLRCKWFPRTARSSGRIVVDDPISFDYLEPATLRALGLKERTSRGSKPIAVREGLPSGGMEWWTKTAYDLDFNMIIITEMDQQDRVKAYHLMKADGTIKETRGPTDVPFNAPHGGENENAAGGHPTVEEDDNYSPETLVAPPAPTPSVKPPATPKPAMDKPPRQQTPADEKPTTTTKPPRTPTAPPAGVTGPTPVVQPVSQPDTSVNRPTPIPTSAKGNAHVLCVLDTSAHVGEPECYCVMVSTVKGKQSYTLFFHFADEEEGETGVDMAKEVVTHKNFDNILEKSFFSDAPGSAFGVPDDILARFNTEIARIEKESSFEAIGATWESSADFLMRYKQGRFVPAEFTQKPAPPPQTVVKTPPTDTQEPVAPPPVVPITPASEDTPAPTPDLVIEQLGVVVLDGVSYLYVDAGEDDKAGLKRLGYEYFNAFICRKIPNLQGISRTLEDIASRKVRTENEEDWSVEMKRAISNRALKSINTIAREQLTAMRKGQVRSTKKPVILHSLQIDGTLYCAVSELEHPSALSLVKRVPQFTTRHAGYWLQCLTRDGAKTAVSELAKAGYQIANWSEFSDSLEATFSFTPEVDLTLVSRPPRRGPSPSISTNVSNDEATSTHIEDEPPIVPSVEPAPLFNEGDEGVYINRPNKPTQPVVTPPPAPVGDDPRAMYEELEDLAEGVAPDAVKRIFRRLYDPDDYSELDEEEMEMEITMMKQAKAKLLKLRGEAAAPVAPVAPPAAPSAPKTKLPRLPSVVSKDDPLNSTVSDLADIYKLLDAEEE